MGSGRIGRTGAAKELDAFAVDLAVRAHVRHAHTPYDEILGRGLARSDARSRVHDPGRRRARPLAGHPDV